MKFHKRTTKHNIQPKTENTANVYIAEKVKGTHQMLMNEVFTLKILLTYTV